MDTVRDRLIPLEEVPANRHLVEELFARREISPRARDYALRLLYPARNWGLWISRLLLFVGVALILSGIVYFYAFNWFEITDAVKLVSIEIALSGCIAGTLFYGLDRLAGKVLTLSAGVLTGVFLAVFGQIYQTGADAWTLFATWAALITPWAVLAAFAPLWAVWLIVSNAALALFWDQAAVHTRDMEMLIFPIIGCFNAAVLAAREIAAAKHEWLSGRWTRTLPAAILLGCAVIPGMMRIGQWITLTPDTGMDIAAAFGLVALLGIFGVYRYLKPDMQAVAGAVLCLCAMLEFAVFQTLYHSLRDVVHESGLLLMQSGFTILLFGGVVVWLRAMTQKVEVRHV